jgi:hypothetical protein
MLLPPEREFLAVVEGGEEKAGRQGKEMRT